MSIVESWEYTPLDSFDDPDDYRPDSELALVIDPAQPNGRFVGGLTSSMSEPGAVDPRTPI